MNNVIVDKAKLLEKLKANREKHISDFIELEQERIRRVAEYLTERLVWMEKNPRKQPKLTTNFPEPQNYSENYDEAIAMLEMDTRSEIELTQHEFTTLVLDKWTWKNDFLRTATVYGKA